MFLTKLGWERLKKSSNDEQSLRHTLTFLFAWFILGSAIFVPLAIYMDRAFPSNSDFYSPDVQVGTPLSVGILFATYMGVWWLLSKVLEPPPIWRTWVGRRQSKDE